MNFSEAIAVKTPLDSEAKHVLVHHVQVIVDPSAKPNGFVGDGGRVGRGLGLCCGRGCYTRE